MKRHIFIFCLAVGQLFTSSYGQVTTIATKKFSADDFLTGSLSLGKRGVIMFGREDNTTLAMKYLDSQLETKSTWKFDVEKRSTLIDIKYSEETGTIMAFMHVSKTEYALHTIEVDTKKKKSTPLEVPKGTELSNMVLMGDMIWFIASAKKQSFLFKCPIKSPRLTPVEPQVGQEKPNLTSLQTLDRSELALGYFYGPKKDREFDIAILDKNGKVTIKGLMESLSSEDKQLFIDGSVTNLDNGDYAITGVYNKKGRGVGNGVYFSRYSNGKIGYLSKFDYSDFEHFYDHLSDKKREKIEAKIAKKKDKGKDVTINYQSIMHKARIVNNGLVFIGEYYYPTYRTEYRTTYVNGKPVTTTYTVFDGYQYTHAMAIGISNEGAKLYDLNIPLHIFSKPFVPVRFLKIMSDSNSITTIHTSGRAVFSSVIRDNEIGFNEYAVVTDIPETQKEKWSASTGIWWYDNYFFILEIQKVKEKGTIAKNETQHYAIKIQVE